MARLLPMQECSSRAAVRDIKSAERKCFMSECKDVFLVLCWLGSVGCYAARVFTPLSFYYIYMEWRGAYR
ncbi:MAG: PsiF family protein [Alloprevotella sp.]